MLAIQIGNQTKNYNDANAGWINEQVDRILRSGQSLCVKITINYGSANVVLATPGCGGSMPGGRPPNGLESKIIELWNNSVLKHTALNGGLFVSFLRHVKQLLG